MMAHVSGPLSPTGQTKMELWALRKWISRQKTCLSLSLLPFKWDQYILFIGNINNNNHSTGGTTFSQYVLHLSLPPGLLSGWQRPRRLGHLLPGAGFEVEQLGHELEPVWDAGIAGSVFTCYTTDFGMLYFHAIWKKSHFEFVSIVKVHQSLTFCFCHFPPDPPHFF